MHEDLLHFIWKYRKFPLTGLFTSKNEEIDLVDPGQHNHLAGPDFFNARISIGGQLWAGNVEIHIKSSDWYAHGHEKNSKYDNVILHVVWEDDMPVYRRDKSDIPTLELGNYVARSLLEEYRDLLDKSGKKFINCEKDLGGINTIVVTNWLERLYFERLERKSEQVEEELKHTNNDWEHVLFVLLLKNFGSAVNRDSFLSLAHALDFSMIRRIINDPFKLESVFYGLSGLLHEDFTDSYYIDLKREYKYLASKFDLDGNTVLKPDFFKLRPPNFPTLRLSQLARIYAKNPNLFSKVIELKNRAEFHSIFKVAAGPYWDTRYTFGRETKKRKKTLTANFMDLLLINTIIPLQFCYAKYMGKDVNQEIIKLISELKGERNRIITGFSNIGRKPQNAMESQAMLQLHSEYCTRNKCLQCAIGGTLIKGNM